MCPNIVAEIRVHAVEIYRLTFLVDDCSDVLCEGGCKLIEALEVIAY